MEADGPLIERVLAGESQAFGLLVGRYQDQIYSVCFSTLKNRDEAQEAAQDTFIKAYKALDRYKAESKFSSWLYRIAYNTSLDYIRKRKHTQSIDEIDYSLGGSTEGGDHLMEKSELHQRLLLAIQELPPEEAAIIRMFYLEEMNIKELEQSTGLSNSNVKVKLYRGRKKLAEIIKTRYADIEFDL